MQKLTEFQNSFLMRHLLPIIAMSYGGEVASQENMIAVFESKEFKSIVVKYSTSYLKTKYDISENDVSAFMESSQLKPFLPLLKDTKSLSSVDAVHMVKSMSFRDVVLEQCIKLLPKNVSVGDVQKFASSGTPEFVLSLVKDPEASRLKMRRKFWHQNQLKMVFTKKSRNICQKVCPSTMSRVLPRENL